MKRNTQQSQSGKPSAKAGLRKNPIQPTVAQLVKKELAKQSDPKYWQYANAVNGVDYSGTIYNLLNGLVRGDTSITFDGSSIQPQHLLLRYIWSGSTTNAYNQVRTIIFQWFDTTAPSTSAILAVVGNTTAPMQPTHVQNKRIFKVLFDQMDVLVAPYSAAQTAIVNKVYIPASKFSRVTYQNSANTIVTGGIYLMVISDDAAVDYPDFGFGSEVRFID